MEYLDSGFAMSLRALHPTLSGKLKGAWNLFGMRTIDTVMKKTLPKWWYENKKKRIFENAIGKCSYFVKTRIKEYFILHLVIPG
jgi:hypothetical protein